MAQYIDKDALVAEIERRLDDHKDEYKHSGDIYASVLIEEMEDIIFFINTLEVKEVDVEKEFNDFLDDIEGVPRMWHSDEQIEWGKDIARHFFEFGMIASNKA